MRRIPYQAVFPAADSMGAFSGQPAGGAGFTHDHY